MSESKSDKEHGVQRVLNKLQSSLSKGDYYEAHQLYRTLYFRWGIINCTRYFNFIRITFIHPIRFGLVSTCKLLLYRSFCQSWVFISYYRFLNKKKYDQLRKLLYEGCLQMLEYSQVSWYMNSIDYRWPFISDGRFSILCCRVQVELTWQNCIYPF